MGRPIHPHLRRLVRVLAVVLLLSVTVLGCGAPEPVPVKVFFAGSLLMPFTELEAVYEAEHPGVDLLMEGHGSIQCVRHVTDIHRAIDVVVTADHELIPMLMYATDDPDTGQPYADWYAQFATNRLVLAYTDQSRYADEIDADNWHEVINRRDVRVGLSDPRFDAAGYRVLMIMQLAEAFYDSSILFDRFVQGQFRWPIDVAEENGRQIIHVPEILETRPNARLLMRGSSVQLIALLESGEIDYAFEYESVARQHGFRTVELPPELDLGDPALVDAYSQVEVRLDFRRFQSVEPVFGGGLIIYGVTIPSNAPQPEAAAEFVAWLLSDAGQAYLTEYHQPLIAPPRADHPDQMPAAIRKLTVPLGEG